MNQHCLLLNVFDEMMSFFISEVGKRIGNNPIKKEATDIDVVAINPFSKQALLGKCKFKNSLVDNQLVEDLMARDGLIDHKDTTVAYALFSLSGFND